MSNRDNLGDRMKTYENVTRAHLVRRMPVIIRLERHSTVLPEVFRSLLMRY